MRNLVLLAFIHAFFCTSHGQQDYMSYRTTVETSDTSLSFRLKLGERHGLWKLKCYQNLNTRINTMYVSDEVRDSIQDFFISTVSPLVEPRILDRLHFGEVEFFNEHPVNTIDSLEWNGKHNSTCDEVRYDFKCFFMFDDSLWFPLRLYVNRAGELIHQSSILETLSNLKSFKLPPREAIFEDVYAHKIFKEYGVDGTVNLYYSEKSALFYYEFISRYGKELSKTRNSTTVKMKHMFVDAFTTKILWKPTVVHTNRSGGCTIWTEIKMPKNKLI